GLGNAGVTTAAEEEMKRISAFETAETIETFPAFAAALRARTQLFSPILGPSAPHRCSPDLLKQITVLAREGDVMVHIHVAETRGQAITAQRKFGRSLVSHLDAVGLLNERLSMAHCVWISDKDIALIAERGATVIHNPASNGKL